ncbi:MAG: RNA ligase family protein [Ktedonobacterales bacterium]|nr:RNA ligase family protein [Ktedonobacterales bacterium]
MDAIRKYPRTHHVEGSGLQPGDEDLAMVPFFSLQGRHLVIEEKMDGANSAISFSADRRLRLQSRGHYLTGGPREVHFHPLKAWAHRYTSELWDVLGSRYIMYGEWLYAKHTVFYTDLPHYFMEFDILDTHDDTFLDTPRRQALLANAPFVASVLVLHAGAFASAEALRALVGPSHFIAPDHLARLRGACAQRGIDPDYVLRETDPTTTMEGLYIKVEEDGCVQERYKFVRSSFLQTVIASESHWLDRPIIPNQLRAGSELF